MSTPTSGLSTPGGLPTHSTLTGGGDNNQTVLGEHEMHLLSTTDGVRIDPMASGHLMKDGVKLGGKKILLAYDKTADAELAFDHAVDLFKEGDHVFLTTVLPSSMFDTALAWDDPNYDPEDDKRYLKQMDAVALKKLQEKGKELEKRTGVLVTAHVAHGDVRHSMVALAKFHHVDLIILGRRHLSRFQKILSSGSVSQFVLEHAACSVLVVKT